MSQDTFNRAIIAVRNYRKYTINAAIKGVRNFLVDAGIIGSEYKLTSQQANELWHNAAL